MTIQQKSTKAIHIMLWIAQSVLASTLVWSGWMKLFQSAKELSAMWPWAGEVPAALLKFTGTVDLLAAAGLILPTMLRNRPKLTPIAAVAIIVLMICAAIFHIARGEVSQIGVNIVFALIAAFIAWGRFIKAPVVSK